MKQRDVLEVKIVLRGSPEDVVGALVHGLPRKSLEAVQTALNEELQKRLSAKKGKV